jgi:ubiquinone/menaquinone biosynthesis C-methylase UbiE
MPITRDPHQEEAAILLDAADFRGLRVLEVGCGDGRLTWAFAAQARGVVGLDPREDDIAAARRATPVAVRSRVSFVVGDFQSYQPSSSAETFDLALFSWSLC